MSTGLIIFLVILFIVSLLATFYALRQEENKIKKYEEEGDTPQEEIKRSLDYEKSSLKSNIPIQIWIYTIAILLSLLAFVIYLI
ncbi:hypothetical protein ACDX78_00980 [Virgibacillus oceani]